MSNAIVLGAGMVGVTAAIALRDRGFDVTLVDRSLPGRETSFGNAGIIQSEAVEPYAMPRGWRDLLRIAAGGSNDVHYSLAELPWHLRPLLRYWWQSAPARHRLATASYSRLIARAIGTHAPLIERAGSTGLVHRTGYRVLYREAEALDADIARAHKLRADFGVPFIGLDAAGTLAAEPALKHGGAGSIHWTSPWTVRDPGDLVRAYADLFIRDGGVFVQAAVDRVERAGKGWRVATVSGSLEAEHLVLALGPWSNEVLRPLGLGVPMLLKRGYHRHYASPKKLSAPVLDDAHGCVLAPMRNGTRVTTGAHIVRLGRPGVHRQLERAERAVDDIYDLGSPVEPTPWSGTRPCMPDMLPVIGSVPGAPGLWLNFGHGHQGFTLGPASAELLSALVVGETPPVDPAPFSPSR